MAGLIRRSLQFIFPLTRVRFCSQYSYYSDYESDDDDEDAELYKFFSPQLSPIVRGHRVLLIQPVDVGVTKSILDKGPIKEELILKAKESAALVHSLENWSVVDQVMMTTTGPKSATFFGSGNLEKITNTVRKYPEISAVVLSINSLKARQQVTLEEAFGVPVFDRYSLILQIFAARAKTKASKLQLALAEISYLSQRLKQSIPQNKALGGVGESHFVFGRLPYDERRFILQQRQSRIEKKLAKLKTSREIMMQKRLKSQIPTVAIVGYTNSGKTSLIQRLTQDSRLEPKDVLFATLDLRVYAGKLNSISKVLYLDTIGFITDIPSKLIAAFRSTLEEINLANLVVHLQDITHPDFTKQCGTVHATLKQLEVPSKLTKTMIEVGNKIDQITPQTLSRKCHSDLQISATEGINVDLLEREIEKRLLVNMGCFVGKIRVKTGGPEYVWLTKNAYVLSCQVDPDDENFTVFLTRLTEAVAGKYSKQFGMSSFIYDYQD